jgi:glycosyltransferase involved in cell wall biosynthesis
VIQKSSNPEVCILTPVFNGGKYLAECIESVLAQTYSNWKYVIVNNCSTDDSAKIASGYANKDHRITVVHNHEFVDVIANHNNAFRQLLATSQYCKVLSADDWLKPNCIQELVALAEQDPGIAIVGANVISDSGPTTIGLIRNQSIFDGQEVCRLYLLGKIKSFGTPSAILYRASVVRASDPFFIGVLPNADLAACFRELQTGKFGFVHLPLSYERKHSQAVGSRMEELNSFLVDRLQFLHEFGRECLSPQQREARREELLSQLYRFLGRMLVRPKVKGFWAYHRNRARVIGYPLIEKRMLTTACAEFGEMLANPKRTLKIILNRCMRTKVLQESNAQ